MRLWRRTIFTHLFLLFSVIILVAIGIFSAINYVSVNARLSALAVQNLVALSRSLVVNIDTQLQNLNRISMVPITSRPLQDLLRKSWSEPSTQNAIIEQVSSVNGTLQGVRQINLYNLKGDMIGIGAPQGRYAVDVRDKAWYGQVQAAEGDRIITGVHDDPLIAQLFELDRNRRYISLCRGFYNPETGKPGVIEAEQDCAELFQYLDIMEASAQKGQRIAIIDNDGAQIYPYNRVLPDLGWIVEGRPQDISIQVITSRAPRSGRNTVLAYSHSLDADWSLVLIQDEERLYADIPEFARQLLLYALLVSLVALIGSFWAARRVSVPLHWLSDEMAAFSLEGDPAANGGIAADTAVAEAPPPGRDRRQGLKRAPDTGLAELNGLTLAFDRLRSELRQSFAEAVLLRTHKHRAQLLALQSQMNPHFMFNMLATISVMAEEAQAQDIPALVGNLAEMMRYIASSEDSGHGLGDELDFVRRYLQSMKYRFREDLSFNLVCPEDLAGVVVPRLVLQPFIENAIKHCTRQRPPWVLSVQARRQVTPGATDVWQVLVEDSGPGFDSEHLAGIHREIKRIRTMTPDLADLPGLHIDGMGMLNTFARLQLSYGAAAVMEIGNRPEGGAFVRIGGSINV